MSYRYEFELTVTTEDGKPPTEKDEFSAHLDEIMEALAEMDAVDPLLGANLEEGNVTIAFGETGGDRTDNFQALQRAAGTLRAAIHAAGGHTPGWESINWEISSARRAPDDHLVGA